jgi:enoyl-CoA hydratase/carnithine racemase
MASARLRQLPRWTCATRRQPFCRPWGGRLRHGYRARLRHTHHGAESAKLAAAFVKRGVVPESGGTWFLPRMIGWAKAAELIFTGRTLSAQEALDWGLANEVVPDAALMGRAREIAGNAPLAVQAAKRMMRMGLNETFPDHVHHVYLQLLPLFKTQDMQEGIKAFMEKREPKFEGR